MAVTENSAGYSGMQILLHWVIAALVIFQLVFGEDIGTAYRAFGRGEVPDDSSLFAANLHVYVGIAIFLLAIWRIVLRVQRGVPPLPPGESMIARRIAAATHGILYLVILLMPVSGGAAWFLGSRVAGEVHELAKPVIIVIVALHALGALWQHFVVKSDVLKRMLRPA